MTNGRTAKGSGDGPRTSGLGLVREERGRGKREIPRASPGARGSPLKVAGSRWASVSTERRFSDMLPERESQLSLADPPSGSLSREECPEETQRARSRLKPRPFPQPGQSSPSTEKNTPPHLRPSALSKRAGRGRSRWVRGLRRVASDAGVPAAGGGRGSTAKGERRPLGVGCGLEILREGGWLRG